MSMMTVNPKITSLKQLRSECFSCQLCAIGATRVENRKITGKTHDPHVFAYGNVNAKVFVIGQNPGYNEVLRKRPFVGDSGIFFDERLINIVGLTRQQIYVTNALKCYTPNNRKPERSELDNCRAFLKKELKIIQPMVVVALGNFALDYMTGHTGISSCHGRVEYSKEFDVPVFPMYHPSPMNTNKPALKEKMEKDFTKLRAYISAQEI